MNTSTSTENDIPSKNVLMSQNRLPRALYAHPFYNSNQRQERLIATLCMGIVFREGEIVSM